MRPRLSDVLDVFEAGPMHSRRIRVALINKGFTFSASTLRRLLHLAEDIGEVTSSQQPFGNHDYLWTRNYASQIPASE